MEKSICEQLGAALELDALAIINMPGARLPGQAWHVIIKKNLKGASHKELTSLSVVFVVGRRGSRRWPSLAWSPT